MVRVAVVRPKTMTSKAPSASDDAPTPQRTNGATASVLDRVGTANVTDGQSGTMYAHNLDAGRWVSAALAVPE